MNHFDTRHSFVAVIGDIKDSRHLENRKEVQTHMQTILEQVNEKYEEYIASRFLITLGDEFQGLLYTGENVLHIISEIRMQLYPVHLRFGIGFGQITTDIRAEMALGADGPGYYRAREAIERLKEREKKQEQEIRRLSELSETQRKVIELAEAAKSSGAAKGSEFSKERRSQLQRAIDLLKSCLSKWSFIIRRM